MENTDENIHQHARRIVSGIMQAITYNGFLPKLLGESALRPYTGYNQNVNPAICNVFSTAAYRLGHSMLSPLVQRLGLNPIKFEETFFSSVPKLIQSDGIDPYLAGAATQRMQKLDTKTIDSIRTMLFHREPTPLIDLAALNIQRGRDHGLPDYNTCRVAYGLSPKSDIRDITSDPETQQRLKQAYDGDVRLVDPWIGGLAENHYRDATVGEFFFHVLKDQFERLRDGDRFWYDNDLGLSDAEREEIRTTTLASVIMRNTKIVGLQDNVFEARPAGSSPKPGASRSTRPRKSSRSTSKKKVSRKKRR